MIYMCILYTYTYIYAFSVAISVSSKFLFVLFGAVDIHRDGGAMSFEELWPEYEAKMKAGGKESASDAAISAFKYNFKAGNFWWKNRVVLILDG